MSNINQTQDPFALDTVQDLDNETAAAIQGGAEIIVYTDVNFGGNAFSVVAGNANDLFQFTGEFNNSISSVWVLSGTWDLRTGDDGSGMGITLGPGAYSDFTAFSGGVMNDTVSLAIATTA